MHSEWSRTGFKNLKGKVLDLKSAYEQLAIFPEHRCYSVIAVRDPRDGRQMLFASMALGFGLKSVVYNFLRLSRALSAIMRQILLPSLVDFFDDFTFLEPAATCGSAAEAADAMLSLLGWDIATAEDKHLPSDFSFETLSINLDLSGMSSGRIRVSNKKGRIDSIVERESGKA